MNVYGDSYIHLKMRSRGLITDEHLSHSEEMAAALNVMRSKIKLVSALKKDYKRSAALLYRRGFDTSVICSVLEELHISDYE